MDNEKKVIIRNVSCDVKENDIKNLFLNNKEKYGNNIRIIKIEFIKENDNNSNCIVITFDNKDDADAVTIENSVEIKSNKYKIFIFNNDQLPKTVINEPKIIQSKKETNNELVDNKIKLTIKLNQKGVEIKNEVLKGYLEYLTSLTNDSFAINKIEYDQNATNKNNETIEYTVIFKKKVDLQTVLENHRRHNKFENFEITKVEKLEDTDSIIVESCSAGKNSDSLKLYFLNNIKSGGGHIKDFINIKNNIYYIQFEDKQTVNRVLNKDHDQIKIQPFYGNKDLLINEKGNYFRNIDKNKFPYSYIFTNIMPKRHFNEYLMENNLKLIENNNDIKIEYVGIISSNIENLLKNYENKYTFNEWTVNRETFEIIRKMENIYSVLGINLSSENTIFNKVKIRLEGFKELLDDIKKKVDIIITNNEKEQVPVPVVKEIITKKLKFNIRYVMGKFLYQCRDYVYECLEKNNLKCNYEVDFDRVNEIDEIFTKHCCLTLTAPCEETSHDIKFFIDSNFSIFEFTIKDEFLHILSSYEQFLNDYLDMPNNMNISIIYIKSKNNKKICFCGDKKLVQNLSLTNTFFEQNFVCEENINNISQEYVRFLMLFKQKDIYDACLDEYKKTKSFVSAFIGIISNKINIKITGTQNSRNSIKYKINQMIMNKIEKEITFNLVNNNEPDENALKNIENETFCIIEKLNMPINIDSNRFIYKGVVVEALIGDIHTQRSSLILCPKSGNMLNDILTKTNNQALHFDIQRKVPPCNIEIGNLKVRLVSLESHKVENLIFDSLTYINTNKYTSVAIPIIKTEFEATDHGSLLKIISSIINFLDMNSNLIIREIKICINNSLDDKNILLRAFNDYTINFKEKPIKYKFISNSDYNIQRAINKLQEYLS